MSEMFLTMLRVFMIVFVNITMLITFADHMLERRRSFKWWFIIITFKVVVLDCIFYIMLEQLLMTNTYVQAVYLVISTIASLGMYGVIYYTYNENLAKIFIVSTISEMMDVIIGNLILMMLNSVTGRERFSYQSPMMLIDLLYPFLVAIIVFVVCKVAKPFFERMRKMEVKHKKLWIGVMFVYVGTAMSTNFMAYQQSFLGMILLAITVILCMILGYVRVYYRKVTWERDYLKKQQRLAKMQYSAITCQIEKMEQAQREISEQMRKLSEMPEQESNKAVLIENYIKGLKRKSDSITQGMYCDSWLLDSVLCHQMMACKERNIEADFRLQGYQKGVVREEDLAELVHYLLEAFLEDEAVKYVLLQMASLKGQLVLQLSGDTKGLRISKGKMRKYVKGSQMVFEQKKLKDGEELKVVIS